MNLPQAEQAHVYVCWEDLPEENSPFHASVDQIERVQHPRPLRVAQAKIRLRPSGLRIADVATVEVRDQVQAGDEW